MKRLQARERAPAARRRAGGRHPRGQRIRGLRDRHLGQHAALRLARAAAQDVARSSTPIRKVKGLQVMNDEGVYMFSTYAGQVDPRHAGPPAGRDPAPRLLERLQQLEPGGGHRGRHPRSSPRARYKISIYVLGDEFTGPSVERVLDDGRPPEPARRPASAASASTPSASRPSSARASSRREHHRPLRHADARALRAQRRHLRGPQQHQSLIRVK